MLQLIEDDADVEEAGVAVIPSSEVGRAVL